MLYTKDLERFSSKNRVWQGIPSIEVTKGGRIFSTFYSGNIGEAFDNFCMVLMSDDGGLHFSEPIAVAYLGPFARCYDPNLWIDPLGRLWFTWATYPNPNVFYSICDNPEAEQLTWSEPATLAPEVMMCKPVVLASGEWIFPISVWAKRLRNFIGEDNLDTMRPFAYKSSDCGKSIVKLGGPIVPNDIRMYDEHMLFERKDDGLTMFIRVKYGIAVSHSYDGGKNWTDPVSLSFKGPNTRFFVSRLSSGRLILIYHDSQERCRRENLTAFLSEDDGKTWPYKLLLDERTYVAYPDAKVDEQGNIWITYDRERGGSKKNYQEVVSAAREILMACIREEDILAGRIVCEGSFTKRIVSKLEGDREQGRAIYEMREIQTTEELIDQLSKLPTVAQICDMLYRRFGMVCTLPDKLSKYKIDSAIAELEDSFEDKIRLKALLTRIVNALKEESPCQKDLPDYMFERVIEYVRAHKAEDFKLADMAKDLNISLFYLCHLFKARTGASVMAYKNTLRLIEAKRMLVQSGASMGNVAEKVGFTNVSYFSEIFRESEGMTPQEYRTLHKH